MVIYYHQGFSGGSDSKEFLCNVGDLGLVPGLGRFPGEGNGNSLQYSGLKNSIDRGACQATIHGVTKSRTRLSNFYSLTHYWASLVAQRCRFWMACRRHRRCGFHAWVRKIPWRRAWRSTPVFLSGESHGQMRLVGSQRVRHAWSDWTQAQPSGIANCNNLHHANMGECFLPSILMHYEYLFL